MKVSIEAKAAAQLTQLLSTQSTILDKVELGTVKQIQELLGKIEWTQEAINFINGVEPEPVKKKETKKTPTKKSASKKAKK